MSFTNSGIARPAEITITPWSFQSLGIPFIEANLNGVGDQNWIAVGMVVYIPFVIPEPATAYKMFWGNGAAVAGNIDVGIYGSDGTRLVSIGSTAQATTNTLQVVDITDTLLGRGQYYMAMVSNTSGATQKVRALLPAKGIPQSLGLLQQASVTLPLSTGASPATFAKYDSAFLPYFGVQLYRTLGP